MLAVWSLARQRARRHIRENLQRINPARPGVNARMQAALWLLQEYKSTVVTVVAGNGFSTAVRQNRQRQQPARARRMRQRLWFWVYGVSAMLCEP
jgi:hypothetical protein